MTRPAENPLNRYPAEKVASVCGRLVRGLASEWKLTHDELNILLGPNADVDILYSRTHVRARYCN